MNDLPSFDESRCQHINRCSPGATNTVVTYDKFGMAKKKRGRPITDLRTQYQKNIDRRKDGSAKSRKEQVAKSKRDEAHAVWGPSQPRTGTHPLFEPVRPEPRVLSADSTTPILPLSSSSLISVSAPADVACSSAAFASSASSSIGTRSWSIGTRSSSIRTGSSCIGTGSSSIRTGSSSIRTGSSSIDTGSSSIGTSSSSIRTGSSSIRTGSFAGLRLPSQPIEFFSNPTGNSRKSEAIDSYTDNDTNEVRYKGSNSKTTRWATNNTPRAALDAAKAENKRLWFRDMQERLFQMVSSFGAAEVALFLNTQVFERINKESGDGLCHPGAVHEDGFRCSGHTTVTNVLCPQTPCKENPDIWPGLVSLPVKGGLAVVANREIGEGVALTRYTGKEVTNEEYKQLRPEHQAFAIQHMDCDTWVLPNISKVGPHFMPAISDPGGRIPHSLGPKYNCKVEQTCDRSLVVITTARVQRGERLMFKKV